ncbi:MAG: hypothetical protein R3F34_07910 [Planctomycetota bacterium]
MPIQPTSSRALAVAALTAALLAPTARAQAAVAPERPAPSSAAALAPAPATGPGLFDEVLDAARGARLSLTVRPRYENLATDGFPRRSEAATVRTAFGFETAPFRGLSVGAEVENVTVLGSESFDDGLNGATDRPLVPDPEGTTLNRVFARFVDDSGVALQAGRLAYQLDEGRLVGTNPWRQNDQVYDGLVVESPVLGVLDASYAYLRAVNRPFGDDAPNGRSYMATHVLDVGFAPTDELDVSLYFVQVDVDDDPAHASETLGGRVAGRTPLTLRNDLVWLGELATQSDTGPNPNEYTSSYARARIGLERGAFGIYAQLERLGGGSPAAGDEFSTPLANLDDMNGLLAIFAATPPDGLVDRSIGARVELGRFTLTGAWHDFEAERGGAAYGSEWDVLLSYRAADELELAIQLADYDADGFASDSTDVAFWATLTL